MANTATKLCQIAKQFGTRVRKSMSLKTTVTTYFRPEAEIMLFLRMCKEN